MRMHYPRTPHLPWSPGAASDDVRVVDLSGLAGREVVVTEKLDGENTTLYHDGLHARSLDSAHHPSRAWVKALHSRVARSIPEGWRVCGENLYARHSIGYQDLESWFYAFSVWDGDRCLDWDQGAGFARRLGIPVPPVLWRGVFDERVIRALRPDPLRQEGYVVRAVAGFAREEFAHRVAKWVRPAHVQTDTHWMLAPVVVNGRGPTAALWDVRSRGPVDVPALLDSVDMAGADPGCLDEPARAAAEAASAIDRMDRPGDTRLAGVLATLLHRVDRAWLAPRLVAPLGLPLARRIADLVGLHPRLHRAFPDEARRLGLLRLAVAADPGLLHAVAAAVLTGRTDPEGNEAREQVEWSALHMEDAGLSGETPLAPLRTALRQALGGIDVEVADRCWAQARAAHALGRITGVEEAVAVSWRWRSGDFPRLVVMVGPSGSGKSGFASRLAAGGEADAVVCLDGLRQARGDRSDQRNNAAVLRAGLDRLDAALAGGGRVVWDATCLTESQRSLVHAVADRRDALVTHAVTLVNADLLGRRNASRVHPVPPTVLAAQLARFSPPYPGQAHRTWYVGPDGTVGDVAGTIDGEDP
ncbi:MAG: AAA family ATPase [Dactylosporangium sp.]|nr:AAA family ATPase [Dactylosporangium sp.]NNJ62714.1 AAA family ATPase [Dactylosporangium sp.]